MVARSMIDPTMKNAVVIGASMAGLLAARVLSERFDNVTVIERDNLPDEPALRKGTPHTGHAHALLSRGRQILEELFPGISKALCARGAETSDGGSSVHVLAGGRALACAPIGELGITCSRLLLEDEVRSRVQDLANVRFLTRTDVVECLFDKIANRLSGVRVRMRDPADEILQADLVIDCSGRGSHAPQWLRNSGFEAPDEERITIGVGYATQYFERTESIEATCAVTILTATPEQPRPAVLIAQEPVQGESQPRWVVTFGGFAGDHPEATLEGMRRRVADCGSELIRRVVREATPIGATTRFGFPHSQRRRYERMKRFPEGFLVMGDAIASFNPIYGQGMSVAACEALALREALSQGLPNLHRRFFRAAARAIDNPWRMAAGGDLSIPSVEGPRTLTQRLVNRYMRALFHAAEHDAVLTVAFRKVTNLLKPPASLFHPRIVAKVVRHAVLTKLRNEEVAECATASSRESPNHSH